MTHYSQLSMEDRCQFNTLLQMGLKMAEVARRMERHPSTLYRELKRNTTSNKYSPGRADEKALCRKYRRCNIERYPTLRTYVIKKLKLGWSPEQISGRLKRKKSKYAICHETIYRFIYKFKDKDLYKYLKYKKTNRRRLKTRLRQKCRFGAKRLITERPSAIEARVRCGHWEGDGVEFSNAKSLPITTLVERKTRMLILIKNESKSSKEVMTNIKIKFKEYSKRICKTITFDQGVEFARHEILEGDLKCNVYYCHAHSPWEKGGNENMNGRLRKYLPRKTKISEISQKELDVIAEIMNTTPRKCLDYRTPKELFLKHYKITCRTWV